MSNDIKLINYLRNVEANRLRLLDNLNVKQGTIPDNKSLDNIVNATLNLKSALPESSIHEIRFFDVDGYLLKTEYLPTGATATPPEKLHFSSDRLEFDYWQSALGHNAFENIIGDLDFGAVYKSKRASGSNVAVLELDEVSGLTVSCPYSGNYPAQTLIVDWGDGTVDKLTSGTPTHTYTEYGRYTIELYPDPETSTVVIGQPYSTSSTSLYELSFAGNTGASSSSKYGLFGNTGATNYHVKQMFTYNVLSALCQGMYEKTQFEAFQYLGKWDSYGYLAAGLPILIMSDRHEASFRLGWSNASYATLPYIVCSKKYAFNSNYESAALAVFPSKIVLPENSNMTFTIRYFGYNTSKAHTHFVSYATHFFDKAYTGDLIKPTGGVGTGGRLDGRNTSLTLVHPQQFSTSVIPQAAFYGYNKLIEYVVPSTINVISNYAFAYTPLTRLVLHSNCTCDPNALDYAYSLEDLVLGAGYNADLRLAHNNKLTVPCLVNLLNSLKDNTGDAAKTFTVQYYLNSILQNTYVVLQNGIYVLSEKSNPEAVSILTALINKNWTIASVL